MVLTRRRLPHLYLENTPLFLTWHLYGSLPHKLYPPPGKQNSGKAFVWMDRYLDSARTGPLFLRQEAIARLGGIESLQPFWRTESYDHSVRDLLEGQRIRAYIERQSAVESRDDSRLSKPGGLRHARGHGLG